MKNYFSFIALAALALASCTSDEFVGENKTETLKNEGQILFTTGTSSITRADHVGADAANLLNNRFVVGGFKGTESPATTIVFDNYLVNWTANTAGTTESNTNDWEYVGITAEDPSGISGNTQTIKYWDYSTSQYDYVAYSKGTATNVTASAINAANLTTAAYTLKGSAEDLAKCYIADLVTHYKEEKDPVDHQPDRFLPALFGQIQQSEECRVDLESRRHSDQEQGHFPGCPVFTVPQSHRRHQHAVSG